MMTSPAMFGPFAPVSEVSPAALSNSSSNPFASGEVPSQNVSFENLLLSQTADAPEARPTIRERVHTLHDQLNADQNTSARKLGKRRSEDGSQTLGGMPPVSPETLALHEGAGLGFVGTATPASDASYLAENSEIEPLRLDGRIADDHQGTKPTVFGGNELSQSATDETLGRPDLFRQEDVYSRLDRPIQHQGDIGLDLDTTTEPAAIESLIREGDDSLDAGPPTELTGAELPSNAASTVAADGIAARSSDYSQVANLASPVSFGRPTFDVVENAADRNESRAEREVNLDLDSPQGLSTVNVSVGSGRGRLDANPNAASVDDWHPDVLEPIGERKPQTESGVGQASFSENPLDGLSLEGDVSPAEVIRGVAPEVEEAINEIEGMQVGDKIEIALDPPELGRVVVQLTADGPKVSAKLLVDDHEVAAALENELITLMDSLEAADVVMEDIQVTLQSESDGQGSGRQWAAYREELPFRDAPPAQQPVKEVDKPATSSSSLDIVI